MVYGALGPWGQPHMVPPSEGLGNLEVGRSVQASPAPTKTLQPPRPPERHRVALTTPGAPMAPPLTVGRLLVSFASKFANILE